MIDVKVLFLCGGIGKRMLPLTEDKFLFKFLGRTLLEHQLDLVLKTGLKKVVLVCNSHNEEKIKQIAGSFPGISFEYTRQEKPLGIGNALIDSTAHILNHELIIVNPNDIFESNAYTALLKAHEKHPADSYIIGYKVKEYFPGGYLVTNECGELTHIVEKPGQGNEPSNMVNLLIHYHTDTKTLLDYISRVKTDRDDKYEQGMDAMCKNGKRIYVTPYTGQWKAIKYPWHILDGVRYFLDRAEGYIAPTAQISDRAVIDGKVIIGDNARILENAVIRGPVYIGPGNVIGNSTLIRGYSHLGENCVVGFGTEIKGSYIDKGSWFHMNYIGDSVIGQNCNFGAGTITANWRFDKKNVTVRVDNIAMDTGTDKFGAIVGDKCRIGINVSIMPGVKIGANSTISPAVLLTKNVEPSSIISTRKQSPL